MKNKANLSRRQFMGIAGGLAGAAALVSMPLTASAEEDKPKQNKPKINGDDFITKTHDLDVLVIGGGMAGLFAAIKAHDAGAKVLMVSKRCSLPIL